MKFFSYRDKERVYYNRKLNGFVKKEWDYGYTGIYHKKLEVGILHKLTVGIMKLQYKVVDILDDGVKLGERNTYMSFINVNDPEGKKYKFKVKKGDEEKRDCDKSIKIKPKKLQIVKTILLNILGLICVFTLTILYNLTLPFISLFEKTPENKVEDEYNKYE
jgi:hypothetical protein